MRQLRLRAVRTVDFRYSEVHNIHAVLYAEKITLTKPDDVVLFRSKTGNQLVFVYQIDTVITPNRGAQRVYHTEKLRLEKDSWNPLMLQEYANQVGIVLAGVKSFKTHMKEILDDMQDRMNRNR